MRNREIDAYFKKYPALLEQSLTRKEHLQEILGDLDAAVGSCMCAMERLPEKCVEERADIERLEGEILKLSRTFSVKWKLK